MKQNFLRKNLIALLSVLFVFFISFTAVSAEDELIELKILHTNDMHAKINDFGKIAAYIEEERNAADYSLYLDAGDIFSGNPVVDLQYGVPIVDLLNQMQVDAMAIGNHEFDYGQEETVKRIAQADFPWLSANTSVTSETLVDFPQPEPYKIIDVNGLDVGIFSLTEAPPGTGPLNVVGLEFADPVATAQEYAHLEAETDILIALTHIGYPEDQQLAEAVDFFDVIIGGHSHTTLTEPSVVNGTPIVQTGSDAENVGNLTLQYDPDAGEVVAVDGFLQPVEELETVDENIQEQVIQYNDEMNELLDQVIGETTTGLLRTDYYSTDAPLGNFWTDAMRHHTGADIAFTNNGGMRADIEPGEITVGDIYTVEPFENELMTIEMTGAALKDVIKFSYTRRDQIDLQTSGLHYTILLDEEENYMDVAIEVEGVPLEDEATYVVAISDFFGSGGSGYYFEGEVIEPLTGKMTEAMINYAYYLTDQGQPIDYDHEGRIAVEEIEEEPIEEDPKEEDPIEEDPKDEDPELPRVVEAEINVTDGSVTIADESIAFLETGSPLIIELPAEQDILEVNLTQEQFEIVVEKHAEIYITRIDEEITLQFAASTFSDYDQLSLRLERLAMENPLSAVYDLTFTDGNNVISEFAGPITIVFAVNVDAVKDAEEVKLYRYAEDDEWTAIESVYEDGYALGVTNHFSTFTVFDEVPSTDVIPGEEVDENEEVPTPEIPVTNEETNNNDQTPAERTAAGGGAEQAGDRLPATATSMFNMMAIGFVLLATGIGLFIYRKRKMRLEA